VDRLRRARDAQTRWIFFALLFFLCLAAPVLADDSAEQTSSPATESPLLPPRSLEAEGEWLPDAETIRQGLLEAEREEAERERELQSLEAVDERSRSRQAFADLDAQGAEALLSEKFAAQLASLNGDPARSLSRADQVHPLGEGAATVVEDGDSALLEASIPIEAEDERGELEPLDLSLESTAEGFETANALVEVAVGDSAADPIEVGEEGLSIAQAGTRVDSATRRYGEQNAFQFETFVDTDTLISPTSAGVEIFNVLRSQESPETYTFELEVPPGGELRSNGMGGAEIVKEAKVLATIPFPTAVDAQGSDVPVDLRIEENTIALHVAHREGDYAMPILLDPIVEDWSNAGTYWYGGHSLAALTNGAWQWTQVPAGSPIGLGTGAPCYYTCWGRGLYVTSASGNMGVNVHAHWSYSAPNDQSFVRDIWLPIPARDDHGCPSGQYPQPHDYFGYADNAGNWNYGQVPRTNVAGGGGFSHVGWGRAYVFGLSSGGGANIPCWRDIYVGGIAVYLDDWAAPQVSVPSGVPGGWIDGKTQFTISTTAADAGLGVNRVKLISADQSGQPIVGEKHPSNCTGLYGARCPTTYPASFTQTGGSFGQGVRSAKVYVSDPTGRSAESASIPLKVDLTPPVVTLEGKLAAATKAAEGEAKGDEKVETLRLPVYDLTIKATDEGTETNTEHRKRSGVNNIEVWLKEPGKANKKMSVPWSATPSCAASCPKEGVYSLKLSELTTAGVYRLEAKVIDFVGNEQIRDIEFEYYPATGMKDEYVMHRFPLPDGQSEGEGQPQRPELAVNVMNGNLVFRQVDVDVESSAAVNLEVERYYNSMLPDSENTEWGDGWTLAETPDLKPIGGSALATAATMAASPSGAERYFSLWLDMPTPAGARSGYELNFKYVSANTYDVTLSKWQAGTQTQLAAKTGVSFAVGNSLALVDEGATVSAWTDTGSGFVQRLSAADSAFDQGKTGLFGAGNITRISKFKAGVLNVAPGIAAALAAMPVTEVFDGSAASNTRFANEWSVLGWAGGGTPKGGTTTAGWRPVDAFVSGANGAFYSQNLAPSGGGASQAELVDSSGALESGIVLPTVEGQEKFDPETQATLTKKSGGGYLMTDETGESSAAVAFDQTGQTEALVTADVKVDYSYEGGDLAEIAVEDPGTLQVEPSEVETAEPQPTEGTPGFHSLFGSSGSGAAQFSTPTDVAMGPEGDLWIADYGNHRIQHFNPAGEYVGQFGSLGSAAGKLNNPASIAIDAEGNLWVADKGNSRIQKFSPQGTLLDQSGSLGSGNGQFSRPEGIAIDASGDIWVSDTYNYRIQKLTEQGDFIEVVVPAGLGSIEPTGIDAGPDGKVWVTDWTNNRVVALSEDGDFELSFGTAGSGQGQFNRPDAIEADENGNVWVGDQNNGRIQRFDDEGKYVGQFGSVGSGPGQFGFSYPFGFAVGADRRVWVADRNNNRVQRWDPPFIAGGGTVPEDDDPSVEVETDGGLVEAVSGEEAGAIDYDHQGELLTAVDGPNGETAYEYKNGRLSKVTLSNGTYGSIAYFADGRVESVTIAPGGTNAKTTRFAYTDTGQRKTEVEVPGAPNAIYEIGDDGSLLKWWNKAQPPKLILWGNLYDQKEKDDGLWAGDYLLNAKAEDLEGMSSIEIVAGGTLVEELNCEQVGGSPPECTEPEALPWVMETEVNPRGHMVIEVIATDSDDESTSERFWVDIPEPPPPPAPGTPVAPRFGQIKQFRAEYGLELNFPVGSQTELNERIFNLINAWHEPNTPAGQVARASYERWGIPLRPEDVAELEHREWLYEVNGEAIDGWVEATNPSTYAGYYMDHAAGGIMRIGFTANQDLNLAAVKSALSLVAGTAGAAGDRLQTYPTVPTTSFVSVQATAASVMGAIEANPTLANLVVSVEDDEAGRATRIGTTNVSQVKSILEPLLGTNAPVTVEYEARDGAFLSGRFRNEGRMRAGDYINGKFQIEFGKPDGTDEPCTAGFGAEERREGKAPRVFVLTAGHCYKRLGQEVWRAPYDEEYDYLKHDHVEVGTVRRNAFEYVDPGLARTDGEAIRITQGGVVPVAIWGWGGHPLPTKPAMRAKKGNSLCFSGAISGNISCGRVVARSRRYTGSSQFYAVGGYWVKFPEDKRPGKGDSGSPVWNKLTGRAVGLLSVGRPEGEYVETLVAPLIHPRFARPGELPGILHGQSMEPIQLKLG
jgi:streptogramin lyase